MPQPPVDSDLRPGTRVSISSGNWAGEPGVVVRVEQPAAYVTHRPSEARYRVWFERTDSTELFLASELT